MSIRITMLFILIAGLAVYAWRDWFKALCGLILLMSLIDHPDMPKKIMGIQGLNPWNLLMVSILLSWLATRRREGLVWDMPRHITVMLLLYLGVILAGFSRMMLDRDNMQVPVWHVISDNLINTVKWVIPGILLFDGCRTRRRLLLALCCVLGLYFLAAVQVARAIPPSSILSLEVLTRNRGRIEKATSYNAISAAMMLAGASWAILTTLSLVKRGWQRALVAGASLVVAYGLALTGGRMGYVAWAAVGLILCLLRWRRYLLLAPVVLVVIASVIPSIAERMYVGFGKTDVVGKVRADQYRVASGRLQAWPHVVDKIVKSPIIGYGRAGMVRTGLTEQLQREMIASGFAHPHNAYLCILLDSGLIGFCVVMVFYGFVMAHSARLFLDRRSHLCTAIGGTALALVTAFLVAGLGGQVFYPREPNVGMWTAFFLMFRVSLQRTRARTGLRNSIVARYVPPAPEVYSSSSLQAR